MRRGAERRTLLNCLIAEGLTHGRCCDNAVHLGYISPWAVRIGIKKGINHMYVVHLVGLEESNSMKVFESRQRAAAFANKWARGDDVEKADIYEVEAANARAAVLR